MGRLWECYGNGGLIGSFLRAFGFIARRRAGCCWRTKQIRFSGIARACCRLISSCATKCLAWRMDARCLRISGGLVVEEWRDWGWSAGVSRGVNWVSGSKPGRPLQTPSGKLLLGPSYTHIWIWNPQSQRKKNNIDAPTSSFGNIPNSCWVYIYSIMLEYIHIKFAIYIHNMYIQLYIYYIIL